MSGTGVCVYGEVLFDHFPDGSRVLGGAPFNVAWHLQAFGVRPFFCSRVGEDAEGARVLEAMCDWGMDTAGVGTDAALPTGRVTVRFEADEPVYEITHPAAWDAITSAAMPPARLLYHGSLAMRGTTSRATLRRLLDATDSPVFVDLNLRAPWWNAELVKRALEAASWLKLNRAEFAAVAAPGTTASQLVERHALDGLLLTDGARGAELWLRSGERLHVRPQASAHFVDAVGAGDAFAAVFVLGLCRGWEHALTLQRAQAFASEVVGIRGATTADPGFYRRMTDAWHAEP
jgi:fructokinase